MTEAEKLLEQLTSHTNTPEEALRAINDYTKIIRNKCEEHRVKKLTEWRDTAGEDEEFLVLDILIKSPQFRVNTLETAP